MKNFKNIILASGLLIFAGSANAIVITMDLEDVTNGGGFYGTLTIADTSLNTVTITADIADPINVGLTQGDILGLGLDISNDSLLSGMFLSNFDPAGTITAECYTANGCDVFSGGSDALGQGLDIGIEIGAVGDAGGFLQTISFDLTSIGLDASVFGELGVMRVQSIEGITSYTAGSSKLAGDGVSVPEPSIIALFGLGLVGIGFARRQRSIRS